MTSSPVRRPYGHQVPVDVSVDVAEVLEQLDDDDIREECKLRGLLVVEAQDGDGAISAEAVLDEIYHDLLAKRNAQAAANFERLWRAFLPARLVDAWSAVALGDTAAAICHLDAHKHPPPSATK